jgi:hypothetical protein
MLAFHLHHGVDLVIATDNGSRDGTHAILDCYRKAGSLLLLEEPTHIHDQAPWVTRMARMAAEECGADWVINADADEFWWPRSGDLKSDLAQVDRTKTALSIERTNFLPPGPSTAHDLPFYRTMTVRERQSLNSLGQPLPSKVCHRGNKLISVTDGNHAVQLDGSVLPSPRFDPIEILHFPVRSYRQFERKIRDGARALERNSRTANTSIGISWRQLYHQHLLKDTLPAYYHSLRPSNAEICQALDNGQLIDDRRLQIVLDALEGSPRATDIG